MEHLTTGTRTPLSTTAEIAIVILALLAAIGIVPAFASASNTEDDAAASAAAATAPAGDLKVVNLIAGSGSDASDTFTYTVALAGSAINGTYGDLTFNGGIATVTLQGDQSVRAWGLPACIPYTITAQSADGYVATVSHATGSISAGTTAIATFTNTKAALVA